MLATAVRRAKGHVTLAGTVEGPSRRVTVGTVRFWSECRDSCRLKLGGWKFARLGQVKSGSGWDSGKGNAVHPLASGTASDPYMPGSAR